jgi:octaprenyl-diphosphate synthase
MENPVVTMNSENRVLARQKDHFARINAELGKALRSRVGLIEDIEKHTLLGEGKRLRPLLFVLSSQLCGYRGEDVFRASTIFEYIHAASLLHDDVIDNANIRRRKPSANHIWGNHSAVLEGDYLFSKAMSIAVNVNNLSFLRRLTDATLQMTEGQILESIHTNDWETSKEVYMDVIVAKTASLISAACACGAIISDSKDWAAQSLGEFGLNLGIAFQLMDDLLDYTASPDVLGKPVGKDLREGKITLPLIYTLSRLEKDERRGAERLFETGREEDRGDLVELVRGKGALDEIRGEARVCMERAATCLSAFPESSVKRDLLDLNQYVVERAY